MIHRSSEGVLGVIERYSIRQDTFVSVDGIKERVLGVVEREAIRRDTFVSLDA